MPRVYNPNAVANSVPGQVMQVARDLKDLAGAAQTAIFSMVIGLGGLVVNGVSQFVGAVTGPFVVTGAISASTTVTAGSDLDAGGNVNASGNVNAGSNVTGPQGTFASGLSSVGAYSTDVSLLSGARQQVWQHHSGVYGFAPSSIATKTDLGPVPFTAADVLAVSPYVFHYKGQLAIRDDPQNPQYDPSYVVPWEIGLMAEHLIAHNMSCFVFWEADGTTPKGINYDLFGAIAPLVVLADQEKRLEALERVS